MVVFAKRAFGYVLMGVLIMGMKGDLKPVTEAQEMKSDQLKVDEAAKIRNIVYNDEITIYTDNSNRQSVVRGVEIPDELKELYKEKPIATLTLLHTIVSGARPDDARKAGALAGALVSGPEAGVPIYYTSADHFDDKADSTGRTKRERMSEFLELLIRDAQTDKKSKK